jgi:drug/metabolite transporter (DMT)-like permease
MAKLHLAVFLFGLAGLFGKFLALPPTAIVLGRTSLAAITLLVLIKILSIPLPSRNFIWKSLPSGVLLAIHWVTFFHSIQVSSVAVGLLSFATFPIFVAFLEPLFSRIKLTRRDLLLALAVFVGLIFVVPNYEFGDRVFQGVLWGVLSGLTFAFLTIWNRKLVKDVGAISIGLFQNFWAAIALSPFAPPLLHITFTQGLLLGCLGIFCTALAHWYFIASLKSVRSQVASVTTSLEPVYGILLATILLQEIPTIREIAGGVIILSAVSLSALLENREQQNNQIQRTPLALLI